MFTYAITTRPMRQRGAVLIIGLIFLLVITLIGITAMQRTTLDTKITGNYRSYTIAFEGTESALSGGESRLRLANTRPRIGNNQNTVNLTIWSLGNPFNNCTGNNQVNAAWWFSCPFSWWQDQVNASPSTAYAFPNPLFTLGGNQSQPMYLIEQLSDFQNVGVGPKGKPDFLNWESYEDSPGQKDYYRITARGSTGQQNSQSSDAMLQSVFSWRYPP